jgi:hypothetical protein
MIMMVLRVGLLINAFLSTISVPMKKVYLSIE